MVPPALRNQEGAGGLGPGGGAFLLCREGGAWFPHAELGGGRENMGWPLGLPNLGGGESAFMLWANIRMVAPALTHFWVWMKLECDPVRGGVSVACFLGGSGRLKTVSISRREKSMGCRA